MKCPICQTDLCWESDCDSEEIGYDIKGYLFFYHCEKCGAQIEILMPDVNPYKEGEADD